MEHLYAHLSINQFTLFVFCLARQVIKASYVAVCTGLHVSASIPVIPGIEHVLKDGSPEGKACMSPAVFHSVEYKTRSQLSGRRVMILGTGETGMDLAYEAV